MHYNQIYKLQVQYNVRHLFSLTSGSWKFTRQHATNTSLSINGEIDNEIFPLNLSVIKKSIHKLDKIIGWRLTFVEVYI